MSQSNIRKRMNYRRGNGDNGYCRDCGDMRKQNKLWGKGFLNCIHIGVGTAKKFRIRHDFTCDFFWKKEEANDEL
jgi:hypothetical protein